MRKFFYLFLTFALLGLLIVTNTSFATGLGIQIPSIGSGTANYTVEGDYEDSDYEMDLSHIGIGFVLDTRVANPGVFNYRMNINYETVDLGNEDQWKDGFNSFSIDNTFGFAVLQTTVVRMWIGPQIRIAYMRFSHDDYPVDVNLIGLALAPVLGANFNLGRVVSLCPELGYRFSFYGGSMSWDSEYDIDDRAWTMNNREFFLRFNILFRINDYYDNFF